MEKENKYLKKNKLRAGICFALINIMIALAFFVIEAILAIFYIEFRMLFSVLIGLQRSVLLPLSLGGILIFLLSGEIQRELSREAKALAIAGMAFVCVGTVVITGISTLFSVASRGEIETKKGEELLENRTYDKDEIILKTTYSKPIWGILEKRYTDIEELLLVAIELEYGKEIAFIDKIDYGQAENLYYIREKESKLFFRASYDERMGIEDDYASSRAYAILQKDKPLGDREITPFYDEETGLCRYLMMDCVSFEDAQKAAEDMNKATQILIEDYYFAKGGKGGCILAINNVGVELEEEFGIQPPQVTLSVGDGTSFDNDITRMRVALQQQYAKENTEVTEIEGSTEWAYEKLYQEIFEMQGAAYETTYNAKGNFYAILYQQKKKLNDQTEEMDVEGTVVYNGITKNGKCHEFVYYDTYYKDFENRVEYTTAIVEFYAVNQETGEIYVADKHAWEDLPAKEYREATEE